jgi:hypothetical protein
MAVKQRRFSLLLRWLSSLIAKDPLRYPETGFFTFAARGDGNMRIGYARVWTVEQNLGLRHYDLKPAFVASIRYTSPCQSRILGLLSKASVTIFPPPV